METAIAVEIRDWTPGIWPVLGHCTVVFPALGLGIAGVSVTQSAGYAIVWPRRWRHSKPVRRVTGGYVSDTIVTPTDQVAYTTMSVAIGAELRRLGHIR